MTRPLRLLLLLALLLGPPALLDRRAAPGDAPEAPPTPASVGVESLTGVRLPLTDPATGAPAGALRADRAERVGGEGLRLRFTGLTLVLEPPPDRPAPRCTVAAPAGETVFDVPPGRAGSLLTLLRGDDAGPGARPHRTTLTGPVTATGSDGSTLGAGAVVVEHGPGGRAGRAEAAGPVHAEGPGYALDAAGAVREADGAWRLRGPLRGTLAAGPARRSVLAALPGALPRLDAAAPARFEIASDGDATLAVAPDRRTMLAIPGPAILVERDGAGTPVGVLATDTLDLRLAPATGGGRAGSVVESLDATGTWIALAPEGAQCRVDALARGRWHVATTPAGEIGATLRTADDTEGVLLRAGARVAPPGGTAHTVPGTGTDTAYLIAGAVPRIARAGPDAPLQVHGDADAAGRGCRIAVLDLAAEPEAAAALAPVPTSTAIEALRAALVERRLPAAPARPRAALAGPSLDAAVFPPGADGTRRIEWSLASGGALALRATSGERTWLRAPAGAGALVERGDADASGAAPGTWWDVDAEFPRGAEVRVETRRAGAPRLLVVEPQGDAPVHVSRRGDGDATVLTVRADGRTVLRDEGAPGAEAPGGPIAADRVTIEARGAPAELRRVLAEGRIEGTAPTRVGDAPGPPATWRGDRLEVTVEPQPDGTRLERWQWSGAGEAEAPAGAILDVGGGPLELKGPTGETWRLTAASGEATRVLVPRGRGWATRSITVRAPEGCTLQAFPAGTPPGAPPLATLHAADVQADLEPEGAVARPRLRRLQAGGGVDYAAGDAAGLVGALRAATLTMEATPDPAADGQWVERWTAVGEPVEAVLRTGSRLPVFGGSPTPGDAGGAVHLAARARRLVWTRHIAAASLGQREQLWLDGDPVLEQRAGGDGAAVEWRLAAPGVRAGRLVPANGPARFDLVAEGGVRIDNLDAHGATQGTATAPRLHVQGTRAPGATSAADAAAEFAGPFVAHGVAAREAYARLGQPGGQTDVPGERVRLVCPAGARLTADGAAREIEADPLFLQSLDATQAPTRTWKLARGLRIDDDGDGRWRFTPREGRSVLQPTGAELEELRQLTERR